MVLVLARADAHRDRRQLSPACGVPVEPGWDGYRAQLAVDTGGRVLLRSRQGTEMTGSFPEIRAAVLTQLPADTGLDGELVVWVTGRLAFERLQRPAWMEPIAPWATTATPSPRESTNRSPIWMTSRRVPRVHPDHRRRADADHVRRESVGPDHVHNVDGTADLKTANPAHPRRPLAEALGAAFPRRHHRPRRLPSARSQCHRHIPYRSGE